MWVKLVKAKCETWWKLNLRHDTAGKESVLMKCWLTGTSERHRVSSTRSTFSKPLIRLVGHSLRARDPALLTKDNTTCAWEIRASTECKATGNRFMVGVTRMSVWVGLQRRNIFCLPSLYNHINACKCLYNSSHYAAEHTNISVPKNSVCVFMWSKWQLLMCQFLKVRRQKNRKG